MKKPEEIKKGLEICLAFPTPKDGCNRCPYIRERSTTGICRTSLKNDALALIQQFEAGLIAWEDVASSPGAVEDMAIEINSLQAELATVKQERDALYSDLSTRADACDVCKHGSLYKNDCEEEFGDCGCAFEWRGVCPDTEVQDGK